MVSIIVRSLFAILEPSEVVTNARIHVEDNSISAITTDDSELQDIPVEAVLGGRDSIVSLPFSNILIDIPGSLTKYSRKDVLVENTMSNRDYYLVAALAFSTLLSSGVGLAIITTPRVEPVCRAALEAGLRSIVLLSSKGYDDPEDALRELEKLEERLVKKKFLRLGLEIKDGAQTNNMVKEAVQRGLVLLDNSKKIILADGREYSLYTPLKQSSLYSTSSGNKGPVILDARDWITIDPRSFSYILLSNGMSIDSVLNIHFSPRNLLDLSLRLDRGSEADLLVVSSRKPPVRVLISEEGALAALATDAFVETLIVNGEILVDGSEVISGIEEAANKAIHSLFL